jgi:hypothetical protein
LLEPKSIKSTFMKGETTMKRTFIVVGIAALFALTSMRPLHAEGKKESITGTVVDVYCLVTMDMGGKSHKDCAAQCVTNGSPLGIKEDKTRSVYLAAGEKDMLCAPSGLEKYLEQRVTVRGEVYERNGVRMIIVESTAQAK